MQVNGWPWHIFVSPNSSFSLLCQTFWHPWSRLLYDIEMKSHHFIVIINTLRVKMKWYGNGSHGLPFDLVRILFPSLLSSSVRIMPFSLVCLISVRISPFRFCFRDFLTSVNRYLEVTSRKLKFNNQKQNNRLFCRHSAYFMSSFFQWG